MTTARTRTTGRRQAAAAVKEIFDIAERMAAPDRARRGLGGRPRTDGPRSPGGAALGGGTDAVGGLRRHTMVLTSATLKLGGDFTGVAASVGLREAERHDEPDWMPDPVE